MERLMLKMFLFKGLFHAIKVSLVLWIIAVLSLLIPNEFLANLVVPDIGMPYRLLHYNSAKPYYSEVPPPFVYRAIAYVVWLVGILMWVYFTRIRALALKERAVYLLAFILCFLIFGYLTLFILDLPFLSLMVILVGGT